MKKIITISREFGSGGRELGKRLSEALGVPCYDQQIIELVAEKEKLDPAYVASMSERDVNAFYPATITRGFYRTAYTVLQPTQVRRAEHEIIRKLAAEGDGVFVGRAADLVLEEMKPLRIFVYASEEARVQRCRERAPEGEQLTDKELLKKCRELDRRRADYRALFTDIGWGKAEAYDLCVNTSGRDIKAMVPVIAAFAESWFNEQK
ncbi:MAG: cytidylate kinase-like family protein [Oscillospiraceae bacterium]|nr:cytidylate kinase-like family protein [Oscillospiraceae bacterium]